MISAVENSPLDIFFQNPGIKHKKRMGNISYVQPLTLVMICFQNGTGAERRGS